MTNELLDDYLTPEEKAYFESGESQEFEESAEVDSGDNLDTDANTDSGNAPADGDADVEDEQEQAPQEPMEESDEAIESLESKRDYEKAFKTERHKRKELKEALEATNKRTQEMEATLAALKASMLDAQKPRAQEVKEVVPDAEDDPLGYMQYKTAKLEKAIEQQNQYLKSQHEQQQYNMQEDAFVNDYRAKAQEFAKVTTDFPQAYEFLIASKMAEYEAAGFTLQQAQGLLKEDERATVALAKNAGRNPAESIYNVAKSRGYTGKAKAQAPAAKSLADIQKGMNNSKSLKSGGGELADKEAGLGEIDGMNFDEFDTYWAKLKKQNKGRM